MYCNDTYIFNSMWTGALGSIKVPNKGNESSDSRFGSGDLVVQLNVEPSSDFVRRGNDIYVQIPVQFTTAALGGSVTVPTITGEVDLKVKPGTQSEERVRLRGKGIDNEISGERGNQYVEFKVLIPTQVTDF